MANRDTMRRVTSDGQVKAATTTVDTTEDRVMEDMTPEDIIAIRVKAVTITKAITAQGEKVGL